MSQLLTTYLQDHHAGSVGGLQAFDRVAEHHPDATVREVVADLAEQVREDQAALEEILDQVGGSTSALKDAVTWSGEKLARLKPNERLLERSPLSDVVELETLILGVHGKALLWQALVALGDARLDRSRLDGLLERARNQEATLAELRLSQVGKLAEQ